MIVRLLTLLAACAPVAWGAAEVVESDLPDDVEAFVADRAGWLETLQAWLAGPGVSPFSDDARFELPAGESASADRGSVRMARSPRGGELQEVTDLVLLRGALLGGQPLHGETTVRIKVVAVTPTSAGVDLGLRIEASSVEETPVWQAVSRVTVSLRPTTLVGEPARGSNSGSSAEGRAEAAEWTCNGARVEEWSWSARRSDLFVERTLGVIGGDERAARLLSVGMDRWAQRLDDPAHSAWFGHQGMAAGDVNGDGRPDLLVAMPSGLPNMLLVQQPDGSVRDIAPEVGLAWLDDSKGVLLVDMDGDGRLDAVSSLGHVLVVQRQDERGRFRVAGLGVAPDEAPIYGVSAADVDGDGDLDLFGARYVSTRYADTVPVPFEDARNGPSNVLFRNDAGKFVDVTAAAGLVAGGGRFSLQGSFVDFDVDGDPDLYVVNDFGRNQLFVNEGGRFQDRAGSLGVEDQGAGMGASWSDFDRDGDLDLYVTNMYSSAGRRVAFQEDFAPDRTAEDRAAIRRLSLGNSLLVRDGDRFFDRSDEAGVRMGRWAWGAVFADLDADGSDDLISPSGFLTGPKPGDL